MSNQAADKKNKLDLVVVVSGEDVAVSVNPHQQVARLIEEALRESGNEGQPPEDWVLKAGDTVISSNQTIEASGITAQTKLYLNPKRGEGGELARC